ncbi:MAG: reverse transcriptase domain-containing protein [Kordia sp.]|uniref:reverse transcriptase domain-containing protein n=1 Tax=Kordia sp. TaxID=1965332 RepID=UPI00385B0E71
MPSRCSIDVLTPSRAKSVEEKEDKLKQVVVISQNIRSVNKNINKIHDIIDQKKPDIITLQEIWAPSGSFLIDGYQPPIFKKRQHRKGGGVGTYVSADTKWSPLNDIDIFIEGEYESHAIFLPNINLTVLNIYRPPNGDIGVFMSSIKDQLKKIRDKNHRVLVVGDMNIDYNVNSCIVEEINILLLEEELEQKVNEVTRPESGSILDHCYSEVNWNLNVTLEEFNVSDHLTVIIKLPLYKRKASETIQVTSFNYKDGNIKNISDELRKIDWDNYLLNEDLESSVLKLELLLKTLANEYCKTNIARKKGKPWTPKWLRNKRSRMMAAYNAWKKNRTNMDMEIRYKSLKHDYRKASKMAYNAHLNEKLSEQDSRKLWNNIRELTYTTKPKGNENIKLITAGETENSFNDFFGNIANKVKVTIPETASDPLKYSSQALYKFDLKPPTANELNKLINTMQPKRSAGHDEVSSKLIKLLKFDLIKPLQIISKKMIETSTFPDTWKIAKIIPLYKKGAKDVEGNYRPISLLPAMSKIGEKIVTSQIYKHMEAHNLFPQRQYGFRKGLSTSHAISDLYHEMEKMAARKEKFALILIDFSKAFDLIDHGILYRKLKRLKFGNKTIKLIKSYLTNRKQFVQVNGKNSTTIDAPTVGCPQGSCLGPLLYLLYTLDIERLMNGVFHIMYADDTGILLKINEKNGAEEIESKMKQIVDHFNALRLKMNVDKTEIITNARINKEHITLGANSIKIGHEKTTTYLGIKINPKCSWKDQIVKIKNKVMAGIAALARVKRTAVIKTKVLIYNALIKPHLEYGITSWYPTTTEAEKNTLSRIQKIAVRLIKGVKRPVHINNLYKELKILTLKDLYETAVINDFITYKYTKNPNKKRYKIAENNRRSNGKLLATSRGKTINDHVKILNNTTDSWNTNIFKRKTVIKNIRKERISNYISLCDTTTCYICNNDT